MATNTYYQRIGIALLLLTVAAGCASSGGEKKYSNEEKAQLQIEAATAALSENDTAGALTLLARAEELDPKSANLYYVRSVAFLQRKEFNRAVQDAKKSLEIKPDFAEVSNSLGKMLMDLGRNDEAIVYLKQSAENPLYREAFKPLTLLGILYYRKGDLKPAQEFLQKAAVLDHSRACIAHYYLGHISMQQGQFKEAITSYDNATRKFCVSFTDAHLALGIAFERDHQYTKARQKYLDIKQRYNESPIAAQAMTRLKGLP